VTAQEGGRRSRSWRDATQGSASLLAIIWVVALTALAGAGIVLTAALSARGSVQAAADLGALAGATAVLERSATACARAGVIVAANSARLVDCEVRGAGVRIRVSAPAPAAVTWLLPGRELVVRARAHAELVPVGW
jgi:secretion/DNA translocation related TadE-like protein